MAPIRRMAEGNAAPRSASGQVQRGWTPLTLGSQVQTCFPFQAIHRGVIDHRDRAIARGDAELHPRGRQRGRDRGDVDIAVLDNDVDGCIIMRIDVLVSGEHDRAPDESARNGSPARLLPAGRVDAPTADVQCQGDRVP